MQSGAHDDRDRDRSRLAFARGFPSHARLDALLDAFARGNYRHVRAEAPKLIDSSEPEDVRAAARVVLERTRPDPLAVVLLGLTALLLAFLTAYWAVHAKPSASPPSPPPAIERVHS
jgi:hypothetical protein